MNGNILNHNFNKIDVRLSANEYYDFYLAADEYPIEVYSTIITGDTLSIYIDFSDSNIYGSGTTSAQTIYSLADWSGATNTGVTLYDIGLCGIDNGFVTFEHLSGDTAHTELISAMTLSTLIIPSGETSMFFTRVTGNTGDYIYPIDIVSSSTIGNYAQLCGGFYQGFYKLHEYGYQVQPNRTNNGWVAEFWLNKTNPCSGYTGTILNDDYPTNKGFFFYIGTRAENKYWKCWEGQNTGSTSGCTSGCTTWCTIPKESNSVTSSGIPICPPEITWTEICNQFLIYNRADGHSSCGCNTGGTTNLQLTGYVACNFSGGCVTQSGYTTTLNESDNKFLLFSRSDGHSCDHRATGLTRGQVACSYSGDSVYVTELDVLADVVNNALGFRIKDDGSIGYRRLSYSCVTATTSGVTSVYTGISVEESYSQSGMVLDDQWTHVAVRFMVDYYDDCELQWKDPRIGKLLFYVNGHLKFIVRDFVEMIPKPLSNFREKQQGVAYNMSIGGGSQGLIDSMTFDGPDPNDSGLPIETYFGGSFIGGIAKFRFYIDHLDYCKIKHNFETEEDLYT